jgi:peptidylprolyl isomerase
MTIKILLPTLIITTFLLSACSLFPVNTDQNINLDQKMTVTGTISTSTIVPSKFAASGEQFVSLKTKDGELVLKLYSKETPYTVNNFISKVNSGFYKGLIFHRVIPGFMAQGGDPTGTGTGGNRQKSELNSIPFRRGSLGLARTADTKEYSNDSQFFVCFTTEGCQHLTGDYVNFGEVVSGLDVLDKIIQGDKIIDITSQTK